MLNAGASRARLTVVDDQVGNPTAAGDIAAAILRVVESLSGRTPAALAGTYNLAGAGDVGWCGFAREIFRRARANGYTPVPEVQAIPSRNWPKARPAPERFPARLRPFRGDVRLDGPSLADQPRGVLAELLSPAPDARPDRP